MLAAAPRLYAETLLPSKPAQSPRSMIRVSAVSDVFTQELEAAAQSIPDEIWSSLLEAGWRIYLAEHVVDAVPSLRGTAPRGWPEGTLWDHTDAVHLPASKQLVVAEKRRTRKGSIVRCTRVGGVLRHELGHAFDMIAGQAGQFRSAAPDFLYAYQQDVSAMDDGQRAELQYYLQQSEAGRQETFAEAFGFVLGGGSDAPRQAAFERGFPKTLRVVRQAIEAASKPQVAEAHTTETTYWPPAYSQPVDSASPQRWGARRRWR